MMQQYLDCNAKKDDEWEKFMQQYLSSTEDLKKMIESHPSEPAII
jgi:GTP-binding protein EngB required for normal cell division